MPIRLAAREDAPAMLAIYGQYIDTPITFEYTLPDVEDFTKRVKTTGTRHP